MTSTVLITGCSSGIGRATALEFHQRGWTVHASSRDPSDIEDLGEKGMDTHELDVTSDEEINQVIEEITDEQRLHCVVNNAGNSMIGAVEEITTQELRDQFDVNVFGPHRLIRAAAPHMREHQDGCIVNVSSVSGRIATPGQGSYAASKHALEALSDALRMEMKRFGVDVVLVEPGFVETGFADEALEDLDTENGAYAALYRGMKDAHDNRLAPRAEPDEVATTIVRAASSASPKPRYSVKPSFRLMRMSEHLPDRLTDRVMSRYLS